MAKRVERKEIKVKKSVKRGRVAFVLAFIAVFLLLLNGLLVILMRAKLASLLVVYTGEVINASALLTYGIIWLALAVLIWITAQRIERTQIKSE